MKKILFLIIIPLLIVSCSVFKTVPKERLQTQFLPEYVKNLYLGMPLEKFEEIKDMDKMIVEKGITFRHQYEEIINDEGLESIVYYFDANIASQPLYEMIFIFKPDYDVKSYADEMYGPPSVDDHLPFDEWCWPSGDGFQIVAWTFENKLVIIGTIKKTEWGDLNICGE